MSKTLLGVFSLGTLIFLIKICLGHLVHRESLHSQEYGQAYGDYMINNRYSTHIIEKTILYFIMTPEKQDKTSELSIGFL